MSVDRCPHCQARLEPEKIHGCVIASPPPPRAGFWSEARDGLAAMFSGQFPLRW